MSRAVAVRLTALVESLPCRLFRQSDDRAAELS